MKPLASLLFCLVLVVSTVASGERGLDEVDVAGLRSVTTAAISPDGETIAYTLQVQRQPLSDEDGNPWSELHVVSASGETRPFITGKVNVARIDWLPDGSAISYVAKRNEEKQASLYLIPFHGGESRKVVSYGAGIGEYSFSPDGKHVAFLAKEKESEDIKELKEQGFELEVFEEEARFAKICIASVDDLDTAVRTLELGGHPSELHWSPDGKLLAVALAPTPFIDDQYMRRRIHLVNVASGKVVQKVNNPGKLGQVAWSPDGKQLAVISAGDYKDPKEGRLVRVPVDGSNTFDDLHPGFKGHFERAAWRSNERLLDLAAEGVWTTIGETNSKGHRKILVGPQGPIFKSLDLARDGRRAALVGETPLHPREVFVYEVGKGHPQRLTNSNPLLAERALAQQEVIEYAARDGLKIQGLLIRPLLERPGETVPLILVIHGGPESHNSNGWLTSYSRPGQVAAARGLAVFYPNYRGSTGRGVEFSKLSQGDPAGKEFDDYVDAIDYLVDRGLVDDKRVGITGGSYGGYATAWGATYYSKRFAAAAMSVGISNQLSKWGTSDIPEELMAVHELEPIWDDWEFFLDRSPIKYTDRSETPLLIFHGQKDTRVNPAESLQLLNYIRARGKTDYLRLVKYSQEGHGNRRAAARFDFSVRLNRWMTHYLQGPGGEPPDLRIDYEALLTPPVEPTDQSKPLLGASLQ